MRKRRFFTLLLGLCTVLMLPMAVSAAEPTEIIVNGEDILLAENNTVVCGKGSAVYDESTNTLTLTDATITQISTGSGSGAVNDQGAVKFDGDLNIVLNGVNKIDSAACGIVSTDAGTLTIKGDGSLTIDAVYFGIREGGINSSKNGQADIVIDGGNVDITSAGQGSFSGTGIQAEGDLKILNGALVTSKGEDTGVIGNAGIEISNSTVNTYATDTEGYQAMVSDKDISIKKSVVDASAASEYGDSAIWAKGMVKITDGSNVKVHDTIGNNIYTDTGDIEISGSTFTGTSSGDYPTLYAMNNVSISENSNVTVTAPASNGIFACNGNINIDSSTFTGTSVYPTLHSGYADISIMSSNITASATDDYAIYAYGEAKINGGTVLDITGSKGIGAEPVSLENVKGSINIDGAGQACIYSWSDISFTDCDELSLHGDLAVNAKKDITINTSDLEIFGDEPLYAVNDLSITDSQITVEAERRPIMAKDGTLTFDGETTSVKATGSWFINGSKIEIKNGTIDVDVTADPKESVMAAVFANKGIDISGGKVTAKVTGGEGITTRAMMSNGKIELTGGVITLEGDKVIYVSTNGGELSFGGQDWYQWTNSKLGKPVSSKDTPYVYNQEDSYVRFEPVGTKYKLNVENGEGSGDYMAGEKVEISAKPYDANGHFTGWSITGYDGDILGNVNEPTTTITVPPTAVTVTANYEKHSLTHQDSKDPTCTEVGWEEYDYCTKCDYSTYKEIPAAGHTAGTDWKSDETGHWKECVDCGAKLDKAAHNFKWVTDKEETAAEAGSKHEECTVCGYEKAVVEIPATGDNSKIALWMAVMLAGGAALTGTLVYNHKKKYTR